MLYDHTGKCRRLKKAKDEEDLEPLRGKIKFYEKPYLRLTKPQVKPGVKGKAEVTIGIERYVVFDLPVAEKEQEKLTLPRFIDHCK